MSSRSPSPFGRKFWLSLPFTALIILLDPFGLSDASGRVTQSIFNALASTLYDRTGQDRVSAVVITDDAADDLGGYPLSFDAHAQALKRILCLDPAAVFIDLNFRSVRNDPEGLARFVHDLTYRNGPDGCAPRSEADRAKAAPVFLAVVRNERSPCPSLLDAGADGCEFMEPLQSLLTVATPLDVTGMVEHHQFYSLVGAAPGGEAAPSPALALLQSLCGRGLASGEACEAPLSAFEPRLFLRWGYYRSPLMAARYPDNQCGPPSTEPRPYLDSARNFGRIFAKAAFGSSWWGADTLQRCVYTDYAPLSAFFGLDVNSNPFLRQLIKDRAVVYGANITGVPDLVTSPVHGLVPGLFAHTMAADNLLTEGRDYWKEPPGVLGLINLATLLEIIVTLLAIAGTTWATSKKYRWYFTVSVAAAALFAVTVLWSYVLSYAPLNFVLMLGLTTLTQIIDGLRET
jgi:hypothetical protein